MNEFNAEPDEEMPPKQTAMESEVVEKSGGAGTTKEVSTETKKGGDSDRD